MTETPYILFSKPGVISHGDRSKLGKANILVVEVDDPQAVRLVAGDNLPITELTHGELLAAAASAIASTPYAAAAFGTAVAAAIQQRHGAKGNP